MKEKISELNAKIEELFNSTWGKRLSITSSVFWNLLLIFAIFIAVCGTFVASVGAGYFASLVKDEPLRAQEEMREQILHYEETSEIYFANDVYIGKLRTDLDRREIPLSSVSPILVNAVLATEDEYFREHNGIVPKAVVRGLLQDVSNSATQTGGSTLTQQLIKNQILTNEVSYERKAKEILLAMRIEHFMTKEEILEAYLNIIPYGRNANGTNIAGIAMAAEGIFNVKPADLTLPQAAYIAGIPQAPFKYTPFSVGGTVKSAEGLQPGIDRMKTVLYRMKEEGYISESEYTEAVNYDITQDFRQPEPRADEKYPYLTRELQMRATDIIAKILAEKDGIDPARFEEEENLKTKYTMLAERDVITSGYRIYSTIDKELYDAMNNTARNFKSYGHTYTAQGTNEDGEPITIEMPVEVGSVLIDNKTGRILSFIGGRDFNISQVNHATQAYRSNGSTMKPILAYGPALDYGVIGAGSPLADVKFTRSDGYAPKNFIPHEERGIIPAREALAWSQNLPALRLYNSILDRQPATYLEQLGFSKLTEADKVNLSTSIGGLTNGTTVEENTNAYAAFANSGKFIDAYMISKITDLDGNVIYEHHAEEKQVFSPETAFMLTDMLRDTLTDGTATRAKGMLNFSSDFAAKTGTSQGFKDVWFIGYNPTVTLGVWLGYSQPRSLNTFSNRYGEPSQRVNTLWATLMNTAYSTKKDLIVDGTKYTKPDGVVHASFCGISGLAVSDACSSAGLVRADWFNRKYLPNKIDNSFTTSGSLVEINGNHYQALSTTPAEFLTGSGFGLNPEFAKQFLAPLGGDPAKLIPKNSSLSMSAIGGAAFTPAEGAPAGVQATINGSTMTWSQSGSNDVVGYRVYDLSTGSVVSIVRSSGSRSVNVPAGKTYGVVAVDITGLESSMSNTVSVSAAPEPTVPTDNGSTPEPNNENGSTNGNGNGDNTTGNNNGNGNNGAVDNGETNSNGGTSDNSNEPSNGNNNSNPPPSQPTENTETTE